ncbi:MAG: type 4a pilus biogenesis protein PilO [Thermodesulfobacteriota bacterium]|jgi:type IV pilus assembly protein PilO
MALTMDSILKLSTPKKVLILVAILCVIAGLYLYAFFIPRQDELKVARGELSKLTKELNESRAITRDLQKFKEQVEKLNEELKNALTQLPNEKEIPEILKNISSLGKESNLEFTLFRPKPEEPQQFYAKVPIELVALGSYHNIGIFFDKVSKLPRIINVVDFNMTRAKDIKGRSESEILVKTSCMINTYRFIEKKSEEKKSEKKAVSKETAGEGIPKTEKK